MNLKIPLKSIWPQFGIINEKIDISTLLYLLYRLLHCSYLEMIQLPQLPYFSISFVSLPSNQKSTSPLLWYSLLDLLKASQCSCRETSSSLSFDLNLSSHCFCAILLVLPGWTYTLIPICYVADLKITNLTKDPKKPNRYDFSCMGIYV